MPAQRTWVGTDDLFEAVDSGQFKRAEKTTLTKVYWGDYDACIVDSPLKGSAGTGPLFGYIVQSADVQKSRGGIGRLTVIWEIGGSDAGGGDQEETLPPDRFSLQGNEQNPSVEKNFGFVHAAYDTNHYNKLGLVGTDERNEDFKTLMGWVRTAGLAVDNQSDAAYGVLKFFFRAFGEDKFAEALVLADLLRRGIQNFYYAALEYRWTTHSYTEPNFSYGGFVETPQGPLGPGLVQLKMQCLRACDDLTYDGTVYELTRRWICVPPMPKNLPPEVQPHWEPVLYPPLPKP